MIMNKTDMKLMMMEFVKWTFKNNIRLDIYKYDEIESFIETFMKER